MKNSRKVIFIKNDSKPFRAMKTGRNQECRCGSGLKAKRCCGSSTKYYLPKEKEDKQ